jgi:hypothetical protein
LGHEPWAARAEMLTRPTAHRQPIACSWLPPAYKPGSVERLAPLGRSFLSECSHLHPQAAYPQRLCRGGQPLAAYLALLRLGFTLPPSLPRARCALTAPFHPCLFPRDEPLGHRRCVFCGTVRRATSHPATRPGITWQPVQRARTFLGRAPKDTRATVRPAAITMVEI